MITSLTEGRKADFFKEIPRAIMTKTAPKRKQVFADGFYGYKYSNLFLDLYGGNSKDLIVLFEDGIIL